MSDELLSDLNEAQREAVTFGEGPLLVIAGVGTGKTTVITRRIAWLIAEKKAKPAEILALTFTERAAAEMEERVDKLVPYGYIEARIGTFHAFCDRLLRENAILLGLAPDYRILTEAEEVIFLKEHLFELPVARLRPLGNPMKHLQAILKLFSRAKDEDVAPDEYLAHAATLKDELASFSGDDEERALLEADLSQQEELAAIYAAYQKLLLSHGFVDFGDLIAHALKLLREDPLVRKRVQDRFRYILVDEFQDTNYAQYQLLKLLARHGNLTVVGDDDQAIYKFRGAAISNILGFRKDYPSAHLVVLTENYRSTQEILDASYRLIQKNNPDRLEVTTGIPKRLRAAHGAGRPIVQEHFERIAEECDFVAETIARRARDEERPNRDFAILVRSNAQATPFLHSLNLLKIPWHFSGSRGLYDRDEVKTAIALLRVLADPRDNLSFHYVASSAPYRVPAEDLALATSHAGRKKKSLFEVLRVATKEPDFLGLSAEARVAIGKLLDDIVALLPAATTQRTGEVLYEYLTARTGLLQTLSNSQDPQDALRVQNLAKLFGVIERFAEVARYDRVPWFIDYLDALIEAGDNPPAGEADWDVDAVNVLTVHQAKGLEFPVVFLVGLVEGRFPPAGRREPLELPGRLTKDLVTSEDFHRQEERRLYYVGMTRAKEDLYLSSAQDVGGQRPRKISPFTAEALDLSPQDVKLRRGTSLSAIARHAPPTTVDEEGTLIPRGEAILALSHQKVDDYLSCPMKYRYVHVLRVPIRQHHTVIYGYAIHQAIKLWNLNRLAGAETPLAMLKEVFKKTWQAEGFLTREHEELRYQEGLEALEHFHAYAREDPAVPAHVERHFSITEGDVRVTGIFDRVDLADGGGTVTDYKTSEIEDQAEADKRTKESLQLKIYALAYERLFSELPARVELFHLTPQVLIGRHTPTGKDVEFALKQIHKAAEGIRAGRFPAEPDYFACRYCAYRSICPMGEGQ
jgi:DNA helicase-2/ATP-dependent DNA helicase PcrA